MLLMDTPSPGRSSVKHKDSQPTISQRQWERFQKLKARRIDLCGKATAQRVHAVKKKALRTVCSELTEADKEILAKEGAALNIPTKYSKKRKHPSETKGLTISSESPPSVGPSSSTDQVEEKWKEIKKYLDPNPQLKAWDESSQGQKSGLEKVLDEAVERGELEEASLISDKIANREFATKLATAFDCVEYLKKQKIEEERKRSWKSAKLKWSFEQKKRWEAKGNM